MEDFYIYLVFGVICLIYFFWLFKTFNKRIFFYEGLQQDDIFEVRITECGQVYNNTLKIIYITNDNFNEYADISFNGELYYKVPVNKLYNIVFIYTTYNEIYNVLNTYKSMQ
jgi:hypothetical protein